LLVRPGEVHLFVSIAVYRGVMPGVVNAMLQTSVGTVNNRREPAQLETVKRTQPQRQQSTPVK